ncbi:MAG: hypothetical protein KKA32_07000 [Actinobacteria bacterium]|nr:hypothetical protein [Actinomycetota bacterium]
MTIYEQAGAVSEKEAHEVIELAARYYKRIKAEFPAEITDRSEGEEDR